MVLAVVPGLILLGCAAQGPPHPPRLQVPERVTDLAVHQVGPSLEITFTPPALAMDGEGFTKPLEVEIFREITPVVTTQPSAPRTEAASIAPSTARDSPWVSLSAEELSRLARGHKVVYLELLSQQRFPTAVGSALSYRERSLTRGFRGRAVLSEVSNTAAATVLDVSGPVQNLKVTPTAQALSLTWEAPERTLTGAPVAHVSSYRVYRSEQTAPESFSAVGESKEVTFLDSHFEFGHTYHYKVRAVFKEGSQEAESEDCRPFEVTPRDTFPPAIPQGLTALYSGSAVELVWNANLEPDLAGYNVYRWEEGRQPQRINKVLVRTPVYRDSAIEAKRHYLYQVTAVDLSGNESEPSSEAQTETE